MESSLGKSLMLVWLVIAALSSGVSACRQGTCELDTATSDEIIEAVDLAAETQAPRSEYVLEMGQGEYRYIQNGVTVVLKEDPFDLFVSTGGHVVLTTAGQTAVVGQIAASLVAGEEIWPLDRLELDEAEPHAVCFSLFSESHQQRFSLTLFPGGEDIVNLQMSPESEAPSSYGLTFSLESGRHWYGFGQWSDLSHGLVEEKRFPQPFLLETGVYANDKLITREGSNVISPFWLTATGVGLFCDSYAALGIAWNLENDGRFRLHRVEEWGADEPLKISLIVGENTREAYERWVAQSWEVRPDLPVGGRPADVEFEKPIWTTWAQYKVAITQEKVLDFAKAIADHGYDASYVEIDDRWTRFYGDLDFDKETFPDAAALVDEIHALGFMVSAWIPPFVILEAKNFDEGTIAEAFVASQSSEYPALVGWWDTAFLPISATIDFTTDSGRQWWGAKVQYVVDSYGVDAFKYDAGESQFLPTDVVFDEGVHPNAYPDCYARWGHEYFAAEMRAGWFAQDVPVAFRQFDKDSIWGTDNGLASVLTQYLAMGLIGYPFILPDMVGGNEYIQKADDELFVRWVELNTYLPMVQFSVVPWRDSFSPQVHQMTLALMEKRKTMTGYILQLADEAAATQMPLVRPLFFEFPEDESTYGIEDQFMLGPEILVAPVLHPGVVSRDVYLPAGSWTSLNDEQIHEGPATLADFPAPLGTIPAFRR